MFLFSLLILFRRLLPREELHLVESGSHHLVAGFVSWPKAPPEPLSRLVLAAEGALFSRCTGTGLCKHLGTEQVSSILTWLHRELLGDL